MDKKLHTSVLHLAKEVRKWTESQHRIRLGYDMEVEDLDLHFDLNGWCAIASAELHNRMSLAGISAKIHMAEIDMGCHVFLNVEDYVVDVTATQFSEHRRDKILVIHSREAEMNWFHSPDRTFLNSKKLRAYQIKKGWPQDQVAFPA